MEEGGFTPSASVCVQDDFFSEPGFSEAGLGASVWGAALAGTSVLGVGLAVSVAAIFLEDIIFSLICRQQFDDCLYVVIKYLNYN